MRLKQSAGALLMSMLLVLCSASPSRAPWAQSPSCEPEDHFQNHCEYSCTFLSKTNFLEEDRMECRNGNATADFVLSERDEVHVHMPFEAFPQECR